MIATTRAEIDFEGTGRDRPRVYLDGARSYQMHMGKPTPQIVSVDASRAAKAKRKAQRAARRSSR